MKDENKEISIDAIAEKWASLVLSHIQFKKDQNIKILPDKNKNGNK